MSTTLESIANLYDENVEKLGVTSRSVGWKEETHNLRFDKLMSMVDAQHAKEGFSFNDLGCGYGALIDYADQHQFNLKRFYGYDISNNMLAEARKRFGHDARVSLYNQSLLNTWADYSSTSGIFNVRFEATQAHWESYIKSVLRNLYDCSEVGFSFNMLSIYVDYQEPHLYYGDPLHYFDYCKRLFSRKVNLLHDYPLFEWTITVLK